MVFGEINSALSVWDRLSKWYRSRKNRIVPPVESVATRFVRLLETHGVHRNQIPRFIGCGLTLKDVEDDASLLAKLNEEILETTCKRFAIRREWLDGAETQVYPHHHFYKHPHDFLRFVEGLTISNPDGGMQGVLIAPHETNLKSHALLILEETVGYVGEKPIMRYHLCDNWAFTYWKARAYLTACIAISWKRKIYIHGISMPKKQIEQLAFGETLLGWQGEGIWELGHMTWHPEDMTLRPEAFLEGVDPEQDNFGIKSGLELWLQLEAEGFIDSGFGAASYRQLFEQELAKYPPLPKRKPIIIVD